MIIGERLQQADNRKAFDYAVTMLDLKECLVKTVAELTLSEL